MPQVDDGDQDTVSVCEQGAAVVSPGFAAPAAAIFIAALLGLGCLGRGQVSGQLAKL